MGLLLSAAAQKFNIWHPCWSTCPPLHCLARLQFVTMTLLHFLPVLPQPFTPPVSQLAVQNLLSMLHVCVM